MGLFGKKASGDDSSGRPARAARRAHNDREINRTVKDRNGQAKHSTRDAGRRDWKGGK
jgi:hypothetical protein